MKNTIGKVLTSLLCTMAAVVLLGGCGMGDVRLDKHKTPGKPHSMALGIYMYVTDYQDGIITAVIDNQSGYEMTYGEEYFLQKKENGEWVDLNAVKEYGWKDIAYIIADLDEQEVRYDLSVFGSLKAGEYRLCKQDLYAEFTLK